MAFSDWETVAADNSTTLGVNIAENCPAANMNNAVREVMAQIRAAIHPTLDSFLASTSLSSARSALGVSSGSTSANNFTNLTNSANKVPYMTGSDGWSTADFTSFGRSLVASGNATTALALLGVASGINLTSASFGSNTVDVRITLGNGDTLVIKGGIGTISGGSGDGATSSLTYGVTFSVAPVLIVCGGPSNISSEGSIHNYGTPGTTSASIINTSGFTNTYTWLAIGKLA